jgi:hypothetical protein
MGEGAILRHCGARRSALWAAFLFVGGSGACGKSAGKLADGSPAGAGGSEADAALATGGATGTGGVAIDAGTGPGGATVTGGAMEDAVTGVECSDDGGVSLTAAARQCTQDSDCTIRVAAKCCSADSALGIAKAQASAYSGCFALPPGACSGLRCAKFLGYLTDTGKTTPFQGTATQPLDWVSVSCVDHLCTTDVVSPADAGHDAPPVVDADAGRDAPPAVDAAPDASQLCGSTICRSGQACVLKMPGVAPRCMAATDGGCPFGLSPVASCDSYTGRFSPGCADPAPAPGCVDIPDACDSLCKCLCGLSENMGCFRFPGYLSCAYP